MRPHALHLPALAMTTFLPLLGCATDDAATPAATTTPAPEAADPGTPDTHGHHHKGHGPHRFENADAWAKQFEDPARDAWQKPDDVVAALALSPSSKVADIGSATGYFAARIARAVPDGVVYGVDIEPDMARYLTERAAREGLSNLHAVVAAPDDPKLPEAVDRVLVVDTYHHIEGRLAYFGALRAHLTPGARVAIVDFKMGELPVGPPESMRIAPERITEEMAAAGYRVVVDDRTTLPYQAILIYEAVPDGAGE